MICFPVSELKDGNKAETMTKARTIAIIVSKNDSPKNWIIKFFRTAPDTFLIPISQALFADRAVERLMKLMQDIITINTAITE